jgi:uncharacterized membrane protein
MVGYIKTGSELDGGTIALVEPAINTVAYHFHEQIWKRLQQQYSSNEQYAVHHF